MWTYFSELWAKMAFFHSCDDHKHAFSHMAVESQRGLISCPSSTKILQCTGGHVSEGRSRQMNLLFDTPLPLHYCEIWLALVSQSEEHVCAGVCVCVCLGCILLGNHIWNRMNHCLYITSQLWRPLRSPEGWLIFCIQRQTGKTESTKHIVGAWKRANIATAS